MSPATHAFCSNEARMGVNRREQVQREASPVHLFKKLSHTATVVMLETEAIANESFKAMLAPILRE